MSAMANQIVRILSTALQLTVVAGTTWTTSGQCSSSPSLLTIDEVERFSETTFDYVIIGLSISMHTG